MDDQDPMTSVGFPGSMNANVIAAMLGGWGYPAASSAGGPALPVSLPNVHNMNFNHSSMLAPQIQPSPAGFDTGVYMAELFRLHAFSLAAAQQAMRGTTAGHSHQAAGYHHKPVINPLYQLLGAGPGPAGDLGNASAAAVSRFAAAASPDVAAAAAAAMGLRNMAPVGVAGTAAGATVSMDGVAPRARQKKPMCFIEGCTSQAVHRGICVKHGARGRSQNCLQPNCTSKAVLKGVCVRHGARGMCSFAGCNSNALRRKLCVKHGANGICRVPTCTTNVQSRGLCCKHGARRLCCVPNCNDNVYYLSKEKLCKAHTQASQRQSSEANAAAAVANASAAATNAAAAAMVASQPPQEQPAAKEPTVADEPEKQQPQPVAPALATTSLSPVAVAATPT